MWIGIGMTLYILPYSFVYPDADPYGSALILVGWIRIQEGKNYPKNNLRAEDFSCILDVSHGGLEINKLQFW